MRKVIAVIGAIIGGGIIGFTIGLLLCITFLPMIQDAFLRVVFWAGVYIIIVFVGAAFGNLWAKWILGRKLF